MTLFFSLSVILFIVLGRVKIFIASKISFTLLSHFAESVSDAAKSLSLFSH